MEDKQLYTIIMRHDTSTQWAVNNPILAYGEYGVEDDTHRVKRGDGELEWNDLPYEEFGLVYLVTYKNLSGEVSDNQNLQNALDKKMSINVFDDVDHAVISTIDIVAENGAIARLNKITKNIDTAITSSNVVLIRSADNSVQGYWSTTNEGVRVLNLIAESSITDYEVGHKYYRDQLCYYRNRLYRAVEEFEAEQDFNPIHWIILASKHAEDIKYDNLASELDATLVQDAIDELKRRNDTKLSKTTEQRVVYGTTSAGTQTLIPIDELRTVDTVNGIPATDQEMKNIQIDASDINYDDEAQEPETIKEKLDQKVDKTVAGVGAKIVRNVQFNYDSQTGHIELLEDKVSLEDGSSNEETTEIDVVAEQELASEVQTLNNRIDNEVQTLNTTISTEVQTLNNTIDSEVSTLTSLINTQTDRLDGRIDNAVTDYNSKISNLTDVVANNKEDIESKLTNAQTAINNRIDSEVQTLNNRIDSEVQTLNNTIDDEVATLNTRIDDEVEDLNSYIDTQDNLKIDKNIADSIVTLLDVATHDTQPTIRITNKNTNSKATTYDYVHFGTQGLIKTRMADADHLIIDSTDIDTINTQQNTRLTNAENRLDVNDTNIASLQEHDINHDRAIASNAAQIAMHETRLDTDEANIEALQQDLEAEATTRENADSALSSRITTNAVNITTKADKEFADLTSDKVVGKLESDTLSGSELFNLKETLVSPVDGSSSVERIKFISSDNTVIATRQADGTIDLATNLDTDVNYFVTTETISTTIADETTLDMTKLTATDKQEVEVQDIITDPEGTWGRVKSVDTTNDTCVVVTFKKHAQAVWGTIKGDITDQQDLQNLISSVTGDIGDEVTARQNADTTLQNNINAEATARQNADSALDTAKVDKVNTANKVYGTDANGEQTTYNKEDFGKVDTVNNVQPDNNKNVEILASDIKLINNNNTPIYTYLNNLSYEMPRIYLSTDEDDSTIPSFKKSVRISKMNYRPSAPTSRELTEYSLKSVGAKDITSSGVYTGCPTPIVFRYDDSSIKKSITLLYDSTRIYYDNTLSGLTATTVVTAIDELKGLVDNLKSDLQNQVKSYAQNTAYTVSGNYTVQNYVTFENNEGVVLMAKVQQAFTSDNTEATVYDSFIKDIEDGNLKLMGIPEQVD